MKRKYYRERRCIELKMKQKNMNVLLWLLQIVLALYNLAGGFYMMHNYQSIASVWALRALSQPMWMSIGVLQIISSICVALPIMKKWPRLTPVAAIVLAVISLMGDALYLQYTRFPGMLWGIIPAVLAAFVAYKRWPRA
jgi:hypothetical protein